MRTQQQKAAWEAIQYRRYMAELRKKAQPLSRINPLTGKPLERQMAEQAAREQAKLDSILRDGELS